MFAKRPQSLAFAGGPGAPRPVEVARAVLTRVAANPALSAGAAGALFLATAGAMILVAGDPNAGAPSVHIRLAQAGAPPPPGWREALTPEQAGPAHVSEDSLRLFATAPGVGDASALDGQAVITLPSTGQERANTGLPAAPLPGLTAPGPGGGLLPIIAADGRTPVQAYARPFQSDGRPKIGLVIGGLGLNAKTTREAIEQLPPDVTLSFVPYAEGLQGWIDLARAGGHEVLLEAPMEPNDYPNNDPGPYTLLANSAAKDTQQKLEWLLSRATGYFGVTNYLGSKFVTSDSAMAAFNGGLRQRGLAFIDDGSAVRQGGGLPRASADRVIDDQLAGDAIDKQLLGLEAAALQNGQSLGTGFAYPVTLGEVARWAAALSSRGYQLAPASALLMRR